MATKTKSDSYAIIAVGGKQYVVHEGERLLVDRLATDEGKTFHPQLLFVGGDGKAQLNPSATVTARVVGHSKTKREAFDQARPWWDHYKVIGRYFTGRLPVRPLLRPSIILDDETRDAIRYRR